ncbi:MAG: hypothetical protein IJM34_04695 [Lachnospiraceae bacterium]|nr:hypothetical protein [Lachnospiraceae bacterium]
MAIFDIFEEVSERAVTKTDTGDTRIFGVVVGEVVKNYSDNYPGRVCVKLHTRDDEANVLQWARVAMLSGGAEWGHYFLPEIGDQVLVVFEEGLIDRPYIIGCIQKAADTFLKKSVHEKNQHKRIVTRHGSSIEFEDVADDKGGDGDGTKDKIYIYTPDKAHSVTMDNEKKLIEIQDKDKNAQIQMKTENGEIVIKAAKKITIKAGDNITVTLNGSSDSGKISISCADFVIDSSGKIELSATQKMAVKGASFSAESQGLMKLNANGATQIQGTPIKIG